MRIGRPARAGHAAASRPQARIRLDNIADGRRGAAEQSSACGCGAGAARGARSVAPRGGAVRRQLRRRARGRARDAGRGITNSRSSRARAAPRAVDSAVEHPRARTWGDRGEAAAGWKARHRAAGARAVRAVGAVGRCGGDAVAGGVGVGTRGPAGAARGAQSARRRVHGTQGPMRRRLGHSGGPRGAARRGGRKSGHGLVCRVGIRPPLCGCPGAPAGVITCLSAPECLYLSSHGGSVFLE